MLTKSAVIPGTVMNLQGLGINMHVLAVPIITFTKLLKEITCRHFSHVIFVQEFAIISFLAQVAQPVLADHSSLSTHVTIRTMSTTDTSSTQKQFTQGCFILCNVVNGLAIRQESIIGSLLSMPGKGNGLAPSCLSRASSISNLQPSTPLTSSSSILLLCDRCALVVCFISIRRLSFDLTH